MFGKTIGGYIMYKPSKRALAVCLVATMCASPFGVSNFAEAGQTYDSSNVGIANKVNDYLDGDNNKKTREHLAQQLPSIQNNTQQMWDMVWKEKSINS